MAFILVRDDAFPGGDTSVGAAGTDTGLVNWIDGFGNTFSISGHVANNIGDPSTDYLSHPAYDHDPLNNYQDGKVRSYADTSAGGASIGGLGRYDAAGDNGYGAFFFYANNSFWIRKVVAGARSYIQSNFASGITVPALHIFDMELEQIDPATTQITLSIYDQSAPTVALATHSITDTDAALQNLSGAWGFSFYSGSFATRIQTFRVDSVLTSGTPSVVSTGKTTVKITSSSSTGGTAPLAYQWYRATFSGFTPGGGNIVSGATSLSLRDTGLTANTTYYYKMVTTDAIAATVTSTALSVTTRPSSAVIGVFVGDSITFGAGAAVPPTTTFASVLSGMDYNVAVYNIGQSGSGTSYWSVGGAPYLAAVALALDVEANRIFIELGVNDSRVSGQVSQATYTSRIAAMAAGYLVDVPGSVVVLNTPTYVYPTAAGFDATSDTRLQEYAVGMISLNNGSTVITAYRTAYADFLANRATYIGVDEIHLTDLGYLVMGTNWATTYAAFFPVPAAGGGGGSKMCYTYIPMNR